eukprot:TRINITY_DN106298_c0_g1_i1.p1 TRINITY_DN106298_c0_g1~~TRINITY_DN106298_c0_g1_i1.p1  ORF type:complete len:482 (+),score=63.25 TRINITY_DN106298_c0_g1_i1:160-1605(+)
MALIDELLSDNLCRELILIQRICGVPGYRPRYTSTLLACAPPWALPAMLTARDIIRNKAEEHYDLYLDLHFETTALACWLPGAEIAAHTDNCQDYLAHRDVSAAVWLNEDFEGGEFFLKDGPAVKMGRGRGAIFEASAVHGVKAVSQGERFSLLLWMTKNSNQAEDVKIVPRLCSPHLMTGAERLFGGGPQGYWPDNGHVDRDVVAGFTGKRVQDLEHKLHTSIDQFQAWYPVERWRAAIALAAFADYENHGEGEQLQKSLAQGLANFLRQREVEFEASRSLWQAQRFLASCERLEVLHEPLSFQFGVPGLTQKFVLDQERQDNLLDILAKMVGNCNQAMRFGNLPPWAADLASNLDIAANQMIVNEYMPGHGIVRHIDLLRFGGKICGVSLGAPASMIFRQLTSDVRIFRGCECKFEDSHFTGRKVEVPLRPGFAYFLEADARYRWTHEIPGDSVGGRRFSITLRTMADEFTELSEQMAS